MTPVICVVHDTVAGVDSVPFFADSVVAAQRSFKKQVNFPSDSYLFHSPADFQLVLIAETDFVSSEYTGGSISYRSIVPVPRDVVMTGAAAVDREMRDEYVRLSSRVESAPLSS